MGLMSKMAGILNTGDIIRKLREVGLSRRDAVRIFNAILDEMKEALKRGEEVEWPFGTLKRVAQPRRSMRGWFLYKITTLYKKPFTVALIKENEIRDPRTVKREKDEERRKLLQTKLAELRQVTLELMKQDAEARRAKRTP